MKEYVVTVAIRVRADRLEDAVGRAHSGISTGIPYSRPHWMDPAAPMPLLMDDVEVVSVLPSLAASPASPEPE